jgi:hypothetical protein
MKAVIRISLLIFAIWLFNHPNAHALYIGLRSAFIEAPLAKAKDDFRQEAERQMQKREEARMKEIDAALEKMDKNEISAP